MKNGINGDDDIRFDGSNECIRKSTLFFHFDEEV